jgi:alkylation response protein AidB-like acyl-CoA dehydrogenase
MSPTDLKHLSEKEAESLAVAEEGREIHWKSKSFMASLFMGDFDINLAYPYPRQSEEDKKIGDEWCQKVEAFCKENVKGDDIDHEGSIPAHVFRGLNELGLFGIKIKKEYGGLGLSQTNYIRILTMVSQYCFSTGATLSAHQSIGVPQPLKLFGTEEQKKKFLPLIAKGSISAFALTEPGAGSDPASMVTEAKFNEEEGHWILNGIKLWCTNGAIADLIVVMARTPDKIVRGKAKKQISAFIVDTHTESVEILQRCEFMGLKGIENALIKFNNVKVPKENLIGEEGQGLKIALTTLNDGRLGIPGIAAGATKKLNEFCQSWAKSRVQWGKPIGEHEEGADKLARMEAGSFAMETLSNFGNALSDKGGIDIRMEAATAKLFCSEMAWGLVDTAIQLRGGRGYESERSMKKRGENDVGIERALRDARINRILEGSTEVMHLFLAREALDGHLQRAGTLFDRRASASQKLMTLLKCSLYYPFWYGKLLLPSFRFYFNFRSPLSGHLRWVNSKTKKLARALFHRMVIIGPKLEKRQLTLSRLVDIGIELGVMGLMSCRVQSELERGEKGNLKKANYWLKSSRIKINQLFKSLNCNVDKEARELSKDLLSKASVFEPFETPDLKYPYREFGRDLTSGDTKERLKGK